MELAVYNFSDTNIVLFLSLSLSDLNRPKKLNDLPKVLPHRVELDGIIRVF